MRVSRRVKAYLIEFVLLFLAVFLGFLADNLREKTAEKEKEEEYVISLMNDINSDKETLQEVIKSNIQRKAELDTLSNLCFDYAQNKNLVPRLYEKYLNLIVRPEFFIPNESTMLQLTYTGGIRLIKNREVVDAVLEYSQFKNIVKEQQKYCEEYQMKTIDMGLKIFKQNQYKKMFENQRLRPHEELNQIDFELIESNEKMMRVFGNEVHFYAEVIEYYKILLGESEKMTDSLLIVLENAYAGISKKEEYEMGLPYGIRSR